MDLCLMIEGQQGVTWEQWRALAGTCEENGVPALFRSDHYLAIGGQYPGAGSLDAWATLAALAAVTTKLRLGTMVSPVTFRHPSEVARVVITADHVSGGRVELGLGAGWYEREHEAHGFPFPPLRTRMDILEEQLQVVLANWGEGPTSFRGKHYTVIDNDAQPKAVQKPHPPLLLGGRAGPRALSLAARYADEYNTAFPTLEQVSERRRLLDEACERVAREPIPLSVMGTVIVGEDQAQVTERAQRLAALSDRDPDALLSSPPPGFVVGTVAQVTEQLGSLRDRGVSRMMCQHLLHDDLETVALIGSALQPAVV